MANLDDLLYKIAITLIPQVGPVYGKNLVSYCGHPEAVFKSKKSNLIKIPGIGASIAEYISQKDILIQAEKELNFIENNNISALFYTDQDYPFRLKNHADAPLLLYFKGNADLNASRTVAIVGTRKPTSYGIKLCEDLVKGLAAYQPVIFSGLAYGIDIVAHRACVRHSIPTVGIVGHGLSVIYPSSHKKVALEMVKSGGLLSEFPSDTLPDGRHFPMRNRVIAAIADALIVVETAEKGGSIITANIANSYHKDVFAIPGRVTDNYSSGCHQLIKGHKASLVENADDVAFMMGWDGEADSSKMQMELFSDFSNEEKNILALLNDRQVWNIDQLAFTTKLSGSQVSANLLNLEFKGMIRTLPGKRYTLV